MKNTIPVKTYKSPFGQLLLGSHGDKLCLCDWQYRKMRRSIDKRVQQTLESGYAEGNSPIIEQAISEIEEYAEGKRCEFTLPLIFCGSDFQQIVWKTLAKIPFGKSASYLELARKTGKPQAVRAVAAANGANAISLFVPCHRIIGSNGKLVGYAGGLHVKEKLLRLEGVLKNRTQPELF